MGLHRKAEKMKYSTLLGIFLLWWLPSAQGDASNVNWCYNNVSCNDDVWFSEPFGECNGTRQSPIDIVTSNVKSNANLTAFNFTGFNNKYALKSIKNTGKTVQVSIGTGLVKISGGGLPTSYDTLQLHLHWGNGSAVPGSEHTVDGKMYPMELHIVNVKSEYNGNTTLALHDSEGLAALGFFIEGQNNSDLPVVWKTVTSYLYNITHGGDEVNITDNFSLDDLLSGVDRTKYYRYLGSLTTPNCDEAVVWTVFKDPIIVSKNLIDVFSSTLHTGNVDTPVMTKTYRKVQNLNGRAITSQISASVPVKPTSLLNFLSIFLLSLFFWKA